MRGSITPNPILDSTTLLAGDIMDMNFSDDIDPQDLKDINDALHQLVWEGLIESHEDNKQDIWIAAMEAIRCGLNEDGEFIFWMADEQKAAHDKGITPGSNNENEDDGVYHD